MEENVDESLLPEEIEFRDLLANTSFSNGTIHESLRFVDQMYDKMVVLKELNKRNPQKLVTTMVHLQLLKAKHSYLMEKCFADDDALARFFYIHEKIITLADKLAEPELDLVENQNQNPAEVHSPVQAEGFEEQEEEVSGDGEELFECSICFDEVYKKHTRAFDECGHRFCKECLKEYYSSTINTGGDVCKIHCPSRECDTLVPDHEIRKLVDDETMQKYERFCLLSFLNTDPNAHWCPYKDCENVMMAEPGQERIRCNVCFRSSCVKCKVPWHHGMSCLECAVNSQPEDKQTAKWKRKHGVKGCPHCGLLSTRISGCPDMICSGCKLHWDWDSVDSGPKETKIERIGFFYPRIMKEVIGSRDTINHWKTDKKGTLKDLAPFLIGSTLLGVPLFCVTGPPAYVVKKYKNREAN